MEVKGRLPWSSNGTFLVEVGIDEDVVSGVYKPGAGERALWDYPSGLFRRERAVYVVSEALGWGLVPETVLREGPLGPGSLQRFVAADFQEHYFTLLERPEHHDTLRAICLFDLLINNGDRKSGHCLLGTDGRVWAIDHGLCLHDEPKLRTVIWDFVGQPLPAGADRRCQPAGCRSPRRAAPPPQPGRARRLRRPGDESGSATVLPRGPIAVGLSLAVGVTVGPLTTAELVDLGDLDALLIRIDHLCADHDWAGVLDLRDRSRRAFEERGRQLWPAASHAEYRLALEAPGREAAAMLVPGAGRFALGPLPEVAASTHEWAELRPYLSGSPEAGMAAHERVVRGEDLTGDRGIDPNVLELPLRLQPWEPDYPLATYRAHKMEVAEVASPDLHPVALPAVEAGGTADASADVPQTGGAANATSGRRVVRPTPTSRRRSLPATPTCHRRAVRPTPTSPARATTRRRSGPWPSWPWPGSRSRTARSRRPPSSATPRPRSPPSSSGPASNRTATCAWPRCRPPTPWPSWPGPRPAAGPTAAVGGWRIGRFSAWWAVAAVAGRLDDWPFRPDDLGAAVAGLRWFRWETGPSATGWSLRLAIEDRSRRRAWAVNATDHA